ncbi:MAG: hypothetical protein JKY19_15935 [Alcanivoracaceae bacterium]|nr:hypothetical protein [Alcanivoracaceae bacterium]
MQAQTKNKLSIIALALLFITPVIVAIVLNSSLIKFSPDSFKNHGDFIKPPIKITDKESLKPFDEYWTVVYQHSGNCADDCLKMFDTLYRIRLSKGHKMKKIKLLVLYPENADIEIPAQYTSIEKQSYTTTDNLNNILTSLSPKSLGNNKGLYLLAPEGFLMMSYAKDFEPSDVIKDLGLLLRARKNEG